MPNSTRIQGNRLPPLRKFLYPKKIRVLKSGLRPPSRHPMQITNYIVRSPLLTTVRQRLLLVDVG